MPSSEGDAASTAAAMSRFAFATLVTSDHYLPGALAVAAALKDIHPTPPADPQVPFQTVCIVTPEAVDVKTIKALRRAFDLVVGVEIIQEQNEANLKLLGESSRLSSPSSGTRAARSQEAVERFLSADST